MARTIKQPKDSGVEGGDLFKAGTRVWGRQGTDEENEFSLTIGWTLREYYGEAGRSSQVAVLWPNGQFRWLMVAALIQDGGKWRIG